MQIIIKDGEINEIIIDISDIDQQIVEHFVVDLKEWLREGPAFYIQNKIESRTKALYEEILPVLSSENATLPTDKKQCCVMWFARPDYKNRRQRDEDDRLMKEQIALQAAAEAEAEARSAAQTAADTQREAIAAAVREAITAAA